MSQESHPPRNRSSGESADRLCCSGHCEVRCGCGSLLARVVGDAVELKCRRCKRTWNIPLRQ